MHALFLYAPRINYHLLHCQDKSKQQLLRLPFTYLLNPVSLNTPFNSLLNSQLILRSVNLGNKATLKHLCKFTLAQNWNNWNIKLIFSKFSFIVYSQNILSFGVGLYLNMSEKHNENFNEHTQYIINFNKNIEKICLENPIISVCLKNGQEFAFNSYTRLRKQ